jgi:hypothetical protein
MLGGAVGIIAGLGGSALISDFLSWPTLISAKAIVAAEPCSRRRWASSSASIPPARQRSSTLSKRSVTSKKIFRGQLSVHSSQDFGVDLEQLVILCEGRSWVGLDRSGRVMKTWE